ncbi:tripartite tricarboxylate transporter substrate-binding protein, partial [Escherichia coli]|nr:tripartite tricarboxylate transporter substrate-binding protein [Escherichia coli]
VPACALAQSYPSRPVRLLVPVSAGGGTDMIARVVADQLSRGMKQPWVVENQGGAGGQIASQATARAEPDGYNLMIGYVSTHGTLPAVRKVPY